MADSVQAGEILRRAVAYPYAVPECSFIYRDGGAEELPAPGPELRGRLSLLAYGSNAAPEALARKLAALPGRTLPVLRAALDGFDVVYSAHVSPYGAIPATLQRSPGTTAPVYVLYPDAEQLQALAASEPNYELRRLAGLELRIDRADPPGELDVFLSRHGCLVLVDETEIALAAIRAEGRRLPELDEAGVLEKARELLAPASSLAEFVAASLDPEVARQRTAVLRQCANRFVFD